MAIMKICYIFLNNIQLIIEEHLSENLLVIPI